MMPNERLRKARIHAGYSSGRSAAENFNWPKPTYGHHENGTRNFSSSDADKYARAFRVSTEWLLLGKNAPKWEGDQKPNPHADNNRANLTAQKQWFERLSDKLEEKGCKPAELAQRSSIEIDRIHKYLEGRVLNPRGNVMAQLAAVLDVSERWLRYGEPNDLVNANYGFQEEAVEYTPPDNSFLSKILQNEEWTSTLKVKTDLLNSIGIYRDDIILYDYDARKSEEINAQTAQAREFSGKVVVVQFYSKEHISAETVLRQYIWPDKLVTNSNTGKNSIISLEDTKLDFEPQVKGIVISSYRDI
ncbi:MAG: helix-turn-helix domain-containing protein [Pseudomonadota bacterium]